MADFTYTVNPDGINEVIEETGNTALMLRQVTWGSRQEKLELRKWIVSSDNEKPYKGFTFSTDEGPHTLAKVLVHHGFGATEDILYELKQRDDFEKSLINVIGKKKVEKAKTEEAESFYDPKMVISGGYDDEE